MYARRIVLAAGSVLLLGLAGSAMARDQDNSGTSPATGMSTTSTKATSTMANRDAMFVKQAAAGNLAEIKMGQIALDKSASADVKQFAQRLVADHTKANDQLMTLAQQKQVTLPTEPMAKDRKAATHLQSKSSASFDKAWTAAMVKDHKKDVSTYTRESMHAKDADVRQYATATLPVLKTHLQMAEQLKTSGAGMDHGSMSGGSMHSDNPASSSSTH